MEDLPEFDFFQEQASYFLDTSFPYWRNYDYPQNYLIPPIYEHRNQNLEDNADLDLRKEQAGIKSKNENQLIVDHEPNDDEPQYVVYKAIQQLILDGFQAPFIAIHDLEVVNHRRYWDQRRFPVNLAENLKYALKICFSEYDFFLLGPKIGMVSINIEGSPHNHYNETAFEQAESVDTLLPLLEECTGVKAPHGRSIKKFVFAPKQVALNGEAAEISQISQWSEKDLLNSMEDADKPPLYTTIRQALIKNEPISNGLFEAYGSVLCAFASSAVFKNKLSIVDATALQTSEIEAGPKKICVKSKKQSEKTKVAECQQFFDQSYSKDDFICTLEKPTLHYLSQFTFLMPNQQKIMMGPSRQLIFGYPETGKTKMLQAKALQLLSRGQSVFILAKDDFVDQYDKLFESYGFNDYTVSSWEEQYCQFFFNIFQWWASKNLGNGQNFIALLYDLVKRDSVDQLKEVAEWLEIFDHVIIDDAGDEACPNIEETSIAYLIIMALASHLYPNKTVWVAVDVFFSKFISDRYKSIIVSIIGNSIMSSEIGRNHYSAIMLDQLLFTSRNECAFIIYSLPEWDATDFALNYHNPGSKIIFLNECKASTILDAWQQLAKMVSDQLRRLIHDEGSITFSDAAVVSYDMSDHLHKTDLFNNYLLQNVIDDRKVKVLSPEPDTFGHKCVLYKWDSIPLKSPVTVFTVCLPQGQRENFNKELLFLDIPKATDKSSVVIATYDENAPPLLPESKFLTASEFF